MEISEFKVFEGTAEFNGANLNVDLVYPVVLEPIQKRLPAQPAFGISVFEQLLKIGYAEIANLRHPVKPPSSGIVLLLDGSTSRYMIMHRRDAGAPTHKLYHSINAGYGNTSGHAFSSEHLHQTGKRELAEETLLVTNDRKPWLIVPKGLEEEISQTLNRWGLDFGSRKRIINLERIEGPDSLVIRDSHHHLIFKEDNIYLALLYEGRTSLSALETYTLVGISSDEVIPLDFEYFENRGQLVHLQRESYLVPFRQLAGFGEVLNYPTVYRAVLNSGRLQITVPEYTKPYFGPDNLKVTHPHVFAPDEMLTSVLGGLGVKDYAGKKRLELELRKTQAALERKNILPPDVIKKV